MEQQTQAPPSPAPSSDPPSPPQKGLDIIQLKSKTIAELMELAHSLNVQGTSGLRKQELIFKILEGQTEKNGPLREGCWRYSPRDTGFLRSPDYNYCRARTTSMCRHPNQAVRSQDRGTVSGQVRPPKDGERYFALLRSRPSTSSRPRRRRTRSSSTTYAALSAKKLRLESRADDMPTRIMDPDADRKASAASSCRRRERARRSCSRRSRLDHGQPPRGMLIVP